MEGNTDLSRQMDQLGRGFAVWANNPRGARSALSKQLGGVLKSLQERARTSPESLGAKQSPYDFFFLLATNEKEREAGQMLAARLRVFAAKWQNTSLQWGDLSRLQNFPN